MGQYAKSVKPAILEEKNLLKQKKLSEYQKYFVILRLNIYIINFKLIKLFNERETNFIRSKNETSNSNR